MTPLPGLLHVMLLLILQVSDVMNSVYRCVCMLQSEAVSADSECSL